MMLTENSFGCFLTQIDSLFPKCQTSWAGEEPLISYYARMNKFTPVDVQKMVDDKFTAANNGR